jgi:ferredoxin
MHEILEDVCEGRGTLDQLDLLEELATVVTDTTMCGLGQTASNPVISTLRCFRDEYVEHIVNQRCPAGVCKALVTYSINEECTGCMLCTKSCPENAISGVKKERHSIDVGKCIRCGACVTVCECEAIDVA